MILDSAHDENLRGYRHAGSTLRWGPGRKSKPSGSIDTKIARRLLSVIRNSDSRFLYDWSL